MRTNYWLKFFGDKPPIALDIGTSSIKLIHLQRLKEGYQLRNLAMIPLPPGVITEDRIAEPETVIEAIKNLASSEKIKAKHVSLAVSGSSVVIKKISVPVMSEAELAESIQAEAEQYIPYNIEDVNLDFYILPQEGQENDQMSVIFVAVKSETIQEYSDIIQGAGFKPSIVDVDAFAIENSYEYSFGIPSGVIGLIDIGANITNINILEEGITSFTRDIPFGGTRYNQAIMQELNVSDEEAEQLKLGITVKDISINQVAPILVSVTQELALIINESLDFFRSTGPEKDISKLVLSGGCAKINGIEQILSELLSCPAEISDPFKNIRVDEREFDPEYVSDMSPLVAVGVGLALRSSADKF
jgi:type IV pilus assembly protein PilM